ncbi:MAG: hypothetical protein N2558_02460 [Patescibacteria group bacterium]|nr:hypothetical protein [Patescibacteria group bacterium]
MVVSPSGSIKDKKSERVYPYLFWEGCSFVFRQKRGGFVVEREDVEDFLSSALIKLGLNEKEKDDFLLAWLPKFQDSPYYFITFLEKDYVDRLFL